MLQTINVCRKSHKLESHQSLTLYIQDLEIGTLFPEANYHKLCKFSVYEKVTESYIGKAGVPVEYSRTARVDDCKPVKYLVQTTLENDCKYLKHWSYVDHCKTALPLMKENYNGKFIELDFSRKLPLRPTSEAHFSGKQFTLQDAIVEPDENQYNYHLSNDTKHDGIVDLV